MHEGSTEKKRMLSEPEISMKERSCDMRLLDKEVEAQILAQVQAFFQVWSWRAYLYSNALTHYSNHTPISPQMATYGSARSLAILSIEGIESPGDKN